MSIYLFSVFLSLTSWDASLRLISFGTCRVASPAGSSSFDDDTWRALEEVGGVARSRKDEMHANPDLWDVELVPVEGGSRRKVSMRRREIILEDGPSLHLAP